MESFQLPVSCRQKKKQDGADDTHDEADENDENIEDLTQIRIF